MVGLRFSLPVPATSFVGRDAELHTIHDLLSAQVRLVTLVGPGGVGKTRLATEACIREAAAYPDGVAFVTLEAVSDADFIMAEIARELAVELSGSDTPLQELIQYLAGKRLLLCIDNWEHLVEAAWQLAPLLAACPDVQVLATSREALRLRGEQLVWIEPLRVPATAQPEAAAASEVVQLFVARAQAVRPGFALDASNTPAVLEICMLLDGLPLAVELAAALVRLFTPPALLAQIKKSQGFASQTGSLRLLAGGPRDLPARQQTMRAAIDWSYNLLSPDEQQVLRRLSVFAGGCDLEAAEAVCEPAEGGVGSLLDVLIALTDKSLLHSDQTQIDGQPRFAMLQTIQQFALAQLEQSGEHAKSRQLHAEFYTSFTERWAAELRGEEPADALAHLDRDYANCQLALTWAVDHNKPTMAHRLCGSLWLFWYWRGLIDEGKQWLDRVLRLEGSIAPAARASALYGASVLALHYDNYEAARLHAIECLAQCRAAGDLSRVSDALRQLAVVEFFENDLQYALSHLQESVVVAREVGYAYGLAESHLKMGWIHCYVQDYELARNHAHEALAFGTDRLVLVSDCCHLLGEIATAQGHFNEAHTWLEKALSVMLDPGRYETLEISVSAGRLALCQGDMHEAEGAFRQCLAGATDAADNFTIVAAVEGFACLAVVRAMPAIAVQLISACDAMRLREAMIRQPHDQAFCDRYIEKARQQLGKDQFAATYQFGATMSLAEAVQLAMQTNLTGAGKPTEKVGRRAFPAGLTAREVEVLRLVAQGMSDNEVAGCLVLSPRTINAHLTSIYSKLGVNSRVAATRFAIEHQLIE
jgi:predicted ATPase/DNA-binding NarL/FixJ family response regulator